MKLERIAKSQYEVSAICDSSGRCQVREKLEELYERYPNAVDEMLSLLAFDLPDSGPDFDNPNKAKQLFKDDSVSVFELKSCEYEDSRHRKNKTMGIRVAFIMESDKHIVCIRAFCKANRTPPREREEAIRLAREFLRERGSN